MCGASCFRDDGRSPHAWRAQLVFLSRSRPALKHTVGVTVRMLFVASALVGVAGCRCATVPDRVFPCDTDVDCLSPGTRCIAGYCATPAADGDHDAGADAGRDAGTDAGLDAGRDTTPPTF